MGSIANRLLSSANGDLHLLCNLQDTLQITEHRLTILSGHNNLPEDHDSESGFPETDPRELV